MVGRRNQGCSFHDLGLNIQLTLAFVVNSLLLILGAALFFGHASDISAFSQMYNALQDSKIGARLLVQHCFSLPWHSWLVVKTLLLVP